MTNVVFYELDIVFEGQIFKSTMLRKFVCDYLATAIDKIQVNIAITKSMQIVAASISEMSLGLDGQRHKYYECKPLAR